MAGARVLPAKLFRYISIFITFYLTELTTLTQNDLKRKTTNIRSCAQANDASSLRFDVN